MPKPNEKDALGIYPSVYLIEDEAFDYLDAVHKCRFVVFRQVGRHAPDVEPSVLFEALGSAYSALWADVS